jgi:hypothetical protein
VTRPVLLALLLALPLRALAAPSEVQFENLTLSPSSTLEIEIAGPLPGVEHDVVRVSGNAVIAGTLEVVLLDGFVPAGGQRFEFLTASSITGAFDSVGLADPPGVELSLEQTSTTLAIVAAAEVPALDARGALVLGLLVVALADVLRRTSRS